MTNLEAIKILDNLKPGDYSNPYEKGEAIVMAISALQAQEAKAQLSAEGTTSDLISRQDALDAIGKCTDIYVNNLPTMVDKAEAYKAISELSPAEPEMNLDEWCTDCKEYDHEKHCCPMWNRVIRQALKDAQPERKKGKWIPENRTIDAFWVCSSCGFPSEAHAANILYNFCPNCGADMREETDAV